MPDMKLDFGMKAGKIKELAAKDPNLAKKVQAGFKRKEKYGSNWQSVDLHDVLEKFAPGVTGEIVGSKVYYTSKDGKYSVICDVAGYCRIYDNETKEYLDINGNSAHNFVNAKGKQQGRPKDDFQSVTHFLIQKK